MSLTFEWFNWFTGTSKDTLFLLTFSCTLNLKKILKQVNNLNARFGEENKKQTSVFSKSPESQFSLI